MLTYIPIIVAIVATLIATATDLWKYKIYNTLTMPLLATGLFYHGYFSGYPGFWYSTAGMIAGFGILITFYLMGGMGAGDIKLMTGIGAWLGAYQIFYIFILSGLATGVYAVILMLLTGTTAETWVKVQMLWIRLKTDVASEANSTRVENEIKRIDRRRRMIPFAAMVCLGTIAIWIWDYIF